MTGIKRLRERLLSEDGSSMISVLVAFIILLLGIAGFSRAVKTANDLVRRAETLNAATGEVLQQFYSSYAEQDWNDLYVLNVSEVNSDGTKADAFNLHGRLRKRVYTVDVTEPDKEDPTQISFEMYFYK